MFKSIKTAEQLVAEKLNNERIARVAQLKRNLQATDYVVLADYDKKKPAIIEQRTAWRAELREIEAQVDEAE